MILHAEPLTGANDLPDVPDADVLALSDDMLAFLEEHIDPDSSGERKAETLLYALLNESGVGIEYDTATRTASETFKSSTGNCLSFTNVFVALARESGLKVTYQEVKVPSAWSLEGQTYVLSRHINAVIDVGGGNAKEVDFDTRAFNDNYDRELVSDRRALAHFYSNVGVEYLQKNQQLEALRYFRKALESDPKYAPGWSNIGVLYSKAGYLDYAEAAYLQALKSDPAELVAMSNLGQLYKRAGQPTLSSWYTERSDRHRMRNPYYRYHLARQAFDAEDYDSAIAHLRYAVRQKRNEGSFYVLMGLSYERVGDRAAAERWLRKVQRLAEEDSRNIRYQTKLESYISRQYPVGE